MEYREVEAATLDEAKFEIKKKYGDSARIIKVTEIQKGGFLGIGKKKSVKVLISISEAELLKRYKENLGINKKKEIKDSRQDNISETIMKNKDSISLSLIMDKLNKIEQELDKNSEENNKIHPNLLEIQQILKKNDFFDDFINELIEDVNTTLAYSKLNDKLELHKYIYNYIKNKLLIVNTMDNKSDKKIFILIGPTGVGKTTTIAKIAANAIKEKLNVELITIDGYRIGAKYQLEKYAEYMRTSVSGIEENMELQKTVDLSNANLILIDTIGRSSRDEINLVKMKQLLKLNNYNPEYILTISASTKKEEVAKIFKSFKIFDYNSIIITKIDESDSIGAILNCAIDKKVRIRYYTNGQRVPNDIEKAEYNNIMNKIDGLEKEVYLNNLAF